MMKMIFKVESYVMANLQFTNNTAKAANDAATYRGGRLCDYLADYVWAFSEGAVHVDIGFCACALDECTELTEDALKQAAQRLDDMVNPDRPENSEKATPAPILSEADRLKDIEDTFVIMKAIINVVSYVMANVKDVNDADCFGSGLSECLARWVAGYSLRAVHVTTNFSACTLGENTWLTEDAVKEAAQRLDDRENPDRPESSEKATPEPILSEADRRKRIADAFAEL